MIDRPDLSHMSVMDISRLLIVCGASDDESDRQFAKFCADELKCRKPSTYVPPRYQARD